MDEERRYGFSWLSLFIKVIIFAIFVLLAIWLISKVTLNGNLLGKEKFDKNLQTMKETSLEYFAVEKNLPTDCDGEVRLTLQDMVDKKLITSLETEDGKSCDLEDSYVSVKKNDGYYDVKIELECGKYDDYIVTTLGKSDCEQCETIISNNKVVSQKTETTTNTDKGTTTNKVVNNTTNNTTNNTSNNTNKNDKTLYYEYVKYSEWQQGNVTGTNVENRKSTINYYDYCTNRMYYTTSWLSTGSASGRNYNYKLQLLDTKNINVTSIYKSSDSYFDNSSLTDYQAYINNRGRQLYMVGNTGEYDIYENNATAFKNSSLKPGNFAYSIGNIYKEGDYYYTNVYITYYNGNGVTPYYYGKVNGTVYFVPAKFAINYCVNDSEYNSGNYYGYSKNLTSQKVINEYRYVSYKWSTSDPADGYVKTGKSEYR